jgi:protein-S-isoprenylcysteine O-methyltransferase Ste14
MTTTTILLLATGGLWMLFERGLDLRDRLRGMGTTTADRGTRRLNAFLLIGGLVAAFAISAVAPAHSPLWIAGARTAGGPAEAGLAVAWIGLAVRVWAIATLGHSFRTTVEVDNGQSVVSSGPYRLVRHHSYTGIMLLTAGLGLASGTWPGLALCLAPPAVSLLRRIQVEEAEMLRVVGAPYQAYLARTKRLIPGLW